MRICSSIILSLVLACSLAGCVNTRSAQYPSSSAGWIVTDPAAILGTFSPVASPNPPAPDAEALAFWRTPATTWISIEMGLVAREYTSPPRAARCYALLAAGINDALLVADAASAKGTPISDDAVIAGVAKRIMSYSHPLQAEMLQQRAAQARWAGVWRGSATIAAVSAGERIGQAVAEKVIDWAQHDHAEDFTPFADPAPAPGVWQRTPPRLWSALDPGWGNVRPIAIPSATQMIAKAPPSWGSAEFRADRAAFAAIQQSLNDADRALARRWAGSMGSVTPAGLWLQIARAKIERDQLDERQAVSIYATLAVAMHDSFIACWQSKYSYLVARPISWMREANPAWLSMLETPPFPSYPSGHATVSGAASAVLAAYFPSYATALRQMAEDAARSRVVGGIHWPIDGRNGLEQGRTIGNWILTHHPGLPNE